MIKLNLKDRKILYQLDINSRQSFSKIGKKVGSHKNVVGYKVKRLKEKGIIKNFYTVIDASKLGYISYRFYLVYQYTTPKIEREIVDYFVNSKYTYWIGSLEGIYDLVVIIWVKDISEFYLFWEESLKKYRNYFQDIVFSIYVQLSHYRYSYLIDEKDERTMTEITGGGKQVEIDDLDYQILKIIAPNSRISTTKIAKNLNTTVKAINHRIKKLMKLGVIQGFRVDIDFSKLGYQYFKADINLKDYKKINQIINYIKLNTHLIYIDKSAGHADLEVEFHLESLNQLHNIMEDLIIKFPNTIKNYKYFNCSEINKIHYMPEK